jgi:hypothetical protein
MLDLVELEGVLLEKAKDTAGGAYYNMGGVVVQHFTVGFNWGA